VPSRLLLLVVLCACAPAVAGAQVLAPPSRRQAPQPEISWDRLTAIVTTLASYDDGVTSQQIDPNVPTQGGYTGYGDGTLTFEQGKGSRQFDVSGRGYVNALRGFGLNPSYGGDARARFSAGTRHRIDFQQAVRYEPYYNIGGFAPLSQAAEEVVVQPEESPLHGSNSARSWAATSRIGFDSQFSRRDVIGLSYSFDTRDYRNQGGDTRSGGGSLFYGHQLSRRSRLRFSYGYTGSRLLEPTIGWVPVETHVAEAALEVEHAFSPTRRLLVSVGGGAIRAFGREQLTLEDIRTWLPAGSGAVRFDWARTWSLSADYRRSVRALQGMSSEAFTTDAGIVSFGGFLARPLELTLSTAYVNGKATAGTPGAYDSYTSTAQLRLQLSSAWSALASYDPYQYDVRHVDPIMRQIPTMIERNALRVGLTMNMPIGRERSTRGRQ
jgi:hypothetical protein